MRRHGAYIALACLLALSAAGELAAAELRFTPSFGVGEDVTDNADETPSHRRTELLTVLQPGFGLSYATPSSTLTAAYTLDYRYFARGTRDNETAHTAALTGSFAVLDQFLMLDVSDTYSRISLDVARDTTRESGYFAQTDQNIATVSPYLRWRLSEKSELKTGGRFSDIRYWSSEGIDRDETGAFAELNQQLTPRTLFTVRYVFNTTRTAELTYLDQGGVLRTGRVDYQDYSVSAGFRHEYRERSAIFGSFGNSWQNFSYQSGARHYFWDGGITHQFGATSVTLESKSRYTEDPLAISERQITHSLKIDRIAARGSLGLSASYDRYLGSGGAIITTGGTVEAANAEAARRDRHGVTVSLTGTRELRPDLASSLTVTGDRVTERVAVDYPYHLAATWTLSYLMGRKTTADFTYTYANYRHKLDSARNCVEINRAVVQLKRSF